MRDVNLIIIMLVEGARVARHGFGDFSNYFASLSNLTLVLCLLYFRVAVFAFSVVVCCLLAFKKIGQSCVTQVIVIQFLFL